MEIPCFCIAVFYFPYKNSSLQMLHFNLPISQIPILNLSSAINITTLKRRWSFTHNTNKSFISSDKNPITSKLPEPHGRIISCYQFKYRRTRRNALSRHENCIPQLQIHSDLLYCNMNAYSSQSLHGISKETYRIMRKEIARVIICQLMNIC